MEPNLFNYATSELSQDAFLLWFLEWSKPENAVYDKMVHETSQKFLRHLINQPESYEISAVECRKQWNNIDVLVLVNDSIVLIIEDKVFTKEHGNQIERYRTMVNSCFSEKEMDVRTVYLKTGNESIHKLHEKTANQGIKIIRRKDMLSFLDNTGSDNIILRDFVLRLRNMERETNAFMNRTFDEWRWNSFAWQGFYMMLEERFLPDAHWDYVSNPKGGFLGCWWHWVGKRDHSLYLQFEQDKLCIKLSFDMGTPKNKEIAWRARDELFAKAKQENLNGVVWPAKMKLGSYMTIACFDPDYVFGQGVIDVDSIKGKLSVIESFIDRL